MGLSMMPAQTAAMSDVPPHMISRATSVTSIIRNLASSFGIAMMTVLINQQNTLHHARLTDALSTDNTAYTSFLAANPATGTTLMATHLAKQSFVMAIQDVFLLTAAFTLLAIVLIFLIVAFHPPFSLFILLNVYLASGPFLLISRRFSRRKEEVEVPDEI